MEYSPAKTEQTVGPNSTANIDTKNILQYKIQEKYSTTNYIKTCHAFGSYFPQKHEMLCFPLKTTARYIIRKKPQCRRFAVLKIQNFAGKWYACT